MTVCVIAVVNTTKPEMSAAVASTTSAGVSAASGGLGQGGKYVPPNQRGGDGRRGEMMGGGSRMGRDGKCVCGGGGGRGGVVMGNCVWTGV